MWPSVYSSAKNSAGWNEIKVMYTDVSEKWRTKSEKRFSGWNKGFWNWYEYLGWLRPLCGEWWELFSNHCACKSWLSWSWPSRDDLRSVLDFGRCGRQVYTKRFTSHQNYVKLKCPLVSSQAHEPIGASQTAASFGAKRHPWGSPRGGVAAPGRLP